MRFYPNTEPLRENQKKIAKQFGITEFDRAQVGSATYTVGFSPTRKKWYGWSHRAVFGFGVGDVVKKGDVIAKGGEFAPPSALDVGFTAKSMDDAKRIAAVFADAVG